jgi:hypothetical protein
MRMPLAHQAVVSGDLDLSARKKIPNVNLQEQ